MTDSPNIPQQSAWDAPLERTIVQISSTCESGAAGVNGIIIFALCNDGTLWWRPAAPNHAWWQLSDVPQPLPPPGGQAVGSSV